MNSQLTPILCRPCGTVFPVVGAWNGAWMQCPRCRSLLTITIQPVRPAPWKPPSSSSLGETILRGLGIAAVAIGVYKIGQAIFDEDFGGGEFPRSFRDELRDEHVARHGLRCPRCWRRARYEDLTIDHVVSVKNGGRTSRGNADLVCRSCNSRKGANNSPLDYLRGRSF